MCPLYLSSSRLHLKGLLGMICEQCKTKHIIRGRHAISLKNGSSMCLLSVATSRRGCCAKSPRQNQDWADSLLDCELYGPSIHLRFSVSQLPRFLVPEHIPGVIDFVSKNETVPKKREVWSRVTNAPRLNKRILRMLVSSDYGKMSFSKFRRETKYKVKKICC